MNQHIEGEKRENHVDLREIFEHFQDPHI